MARIAIGVAALVIGVAADAGVDVGVVSVDLLRSLKVGEGPESLAPAGFSRWYSIFVEFSSLPVSRLGAPSDEVRRYSSIGSELKCLVWVMKFCFNSSLILYHLLIHFFPSSSLCFCNFSHQ